MSYTATDAFAELDSKIFTALDTRDSEALRQLAQQVDAEEAEQLLATAKQIDIDDMAYDEANNN